jgi:hypothetical protein
LLAKIFSQSMAFPFSLLIIYFVVQKTFNFMWSHLLILSLSCLAFGVLLSYCQCL